MVQRIPRQSSIEILGVEGCRYVESGQRRHMIERLAFLDLFDRLLPVGDQRLQ